MKLRLLLLAAGLLTLIVTACAPTIELRNEAYLNDTSLISQDPCSAPCWRGLTPGETPWNTAITQLEDDATLQDVRIQPPAEDSPATAASFQRVDGIPCCLIYSENGITVDQIFLQVAPNMTLEQVIAAYGEPSYIAGRTDSGQSVAEVYFPEHQLVVYAYITDSEEGQVAPTSEIVAILLARPQDIQQAIERSDLYNWNGYQSYAEYFTDQPFDKTAVPTELWTTPETEVTPEGTAETN
jgi:hypothetical protein